MNVHLLLSATLFYLAVSTAGAQSPNHDAGEDIVVERTADLTRIDGSQEYVASIDLGNLPVGRQVVVQLTLRNPYDEEIRFSGTEKRCACSQFKADRKLIPKQDELQCQLRIKTPATQKSLSVSTPVVLVDNGVPVVRMELHYQLDGLLAFAELMSVVRFENGEQNKELKIPILTSPPLDVRKVQVTASENLQDLKFEILAGDNGSFLQSTVPDAIIAKGEVRGELTIAYPATDQGDRFYLIIKDSRSSEISPQVVHFRRQGKGLVATATVRVAGELPAGNSPSEPVSCWHAGVKVPQKLEKLSDGLFRVELRVDENRIDSFTGQSVDSSAKPDVLTWRINNTHAITEMTTTFIVDPAENTPND